MHVYNVKLGFDPKTLTYDNELHEVFAQPRLAVIWNFRKSKHITDQHFIKSCKCIYGKLMDQLPTSFVDFYDIVHKYTGNSETSIMEVSDYWYSRKKSHLYNDKNFKEYWEPFYKCWQNPHLLEVKLPDGSLYDLTSDMVLEHQNYKYKKEEHESEQDYLEREEEKLNTKIKKQLNCKDNKYYLCKYHNVILKNNQDPCPVCGATKCIEIVPIKKILDLLKIEITLTEKDW